MPVVTSLVQAGDINPVHLGVLLIETLAFGLITPPYGLGPLAGPMTVCGASIFPCANLTITVIMAAETVSASLKRKLTAAKITVFCLPLCGHLVGKAACHRRY